VQLERLEHHSRRGHLELASGAMKRFIWLLLLTPCFAQIYPYVPPAPLSGGGSAPSFVQGNFACDVAMNSTMTCTLTGVVAGHLLIAACDTYIGGLTGTPTFTFSSTGDTWSTDIAYNIVANSTRGSCIAHAISVSGGTETVTMTSSQSFAGATQNFFLAEYAKGSIAGTFDQSSSLLNSNVTSFTSGTTGTTGAATELQVGFCNVGASQTWTAGSGFTIRGTDTTTTPSAYEDKYLNANGTYAATMTGTNAAYGPCLTATYK
jgi:hypothetical protein